MNHSLQSLTCALAVALGCTLATTAFAQEDANHADSQTPLASNLFYNYYTQGGMNQVDAQMYLAPRPVPANVGHTYYTYQPLLPHELMYQHNRNYYKWTPGPYYQSPCGGRCGGNCGDCQAACDSGALNKTTVTYSSGWNHVSNLASSYHPFGRIHARLAKHHYCPENAKVRSFQRSGRRCGGGCGAASTK